MRPSHLTVPVVLLFLSCAAPTLRSTFSNPKDQTTRINEPLAPYVPEQQVVAIPLQPPSPSSSRPSATNSPAASLPPSR